MGPKLRIAVIADTHFAAAGQSERRGDLADVLLLRAVHRLNRWLKPDVTLLLGDLLDDGNAPGAADRLCVLRTLTGKLRSPVIAVPGNHDGAPDAFSRVFDRPRDFIDVAGVRFVAFVDPEEPHWNARRTERDLARMAAARHGFDGPIVAVQHVPLFPPGASDCPYNYTNASDVVAAMRAHGIRLAVSGHYHRGMDVVRDGDLRFVAAPALCEAPFQFLMIEFDGEEAVATRHRLRLPDGLGLVDAHIHSQFAYCGENMHFLRARAVGEAMGLGGMVFTEHTGQLYFSPDDFWSGECYVKGLAGAEPRCDRTPDYFAAARAAGVPERCVGLEVDCDFEGNAMVSAADRGRAAFLLGSVHSLRALKGPSPDMAAAGKELLARTEALLRAGVPVIAHPFRLFHRKGVAPPADLFAAVARLLRQYGAAAELNFHTQTPDPEFVRPCLELGVKFSLASDSHNLYEVGELAPHLALLHRCGVAEGDLPRVLLDLGDRRAW